MLSVWFPEVLASNSSNPSPNLFLNLFHFFDFLIHVVDFITCFADFFPFVLLTLVSGHWIEFICLFVSSFRPSIILIRQLRISSSGSFPGFSMPELSACGEWSFGGARLRAPSCFLPFPAVIWVSAGLDFSSGVWEGACYCTVCSWRLCPQYPLVRRKWAALGSVVSVTGELHGRSHAPPSSPPIHFLYSPSFLLTLACELLVALWISKAFPLFLCWW